MFKILFPDPLLDLSYPVASPLIPNTDIPDMETDSNPVKILNNLSSL
jgi:hypothetical protein